MVRVRLVVAVAACVMAAIPGAAAPGPTMGEVPAGREVACQGDAQALPPGTPGEVAQSSVAYTAHNRTVDANTSTVLRVMALAEALDAPVAFRDIVSFEEERVIVCVHEARAVLDRHQAVTALALGAPQTTGGLADLLGEKRLVTVFHTTTRQEVSLDQSTALSAIAFAGAGGEVRLEDVLDIERETRTERTFQQVVDLQDVDAVAAAALEGAREQP